MNLKIGDYMMSTDADILTSNVKNRLGRINEIDSHEIYITLNGLSGYERSFRRSNENITWIRLGNKPIYRLVVW